MKFNKIMLIIMVSFMYLTQIPFLIANFLILTTTDDIVGYFVLAGIILLIITLHIAVFNLIFGIILFFKKRYNPTKLIMILKLVLIPWFGINFYIGLIVFAGTLNPWLFLLAPVVVFLMVVMTYVFMFSLSIYDIAFLINRMVKREIPNNGLNITTIIMLHMFMLDVVFSIVAYSVNKNIE